MHDLQPFNALGGLTPRRDDVGTVTLRETPDMALASVVARQGKQQSCKTALAKLLGSEAPGPGKAALGAALEAVWVGPEQWMVSAPYDTHEDLAGILKSKLKQTASITEQSDAWVCLDLIGPDADVVMERLCNLDIQTMGTGDGTRTTIDHLGCLVIRRSARDGLRILGPRSSAGSLYHAIKTAMRAAL